MADRKAVLIDGVLTYVDLTPEEQAQRDADNAQAATEATAEQTKLAREATFKNDATRADILDKLMNATLAQIDTYVDSAIASTNTTTLRNECRALFKKVIKVLVLNVQR